MKRTPLFETHLKMGGRMVEFGGWEMPLQYADILTEHAAVRSAAGLFDVSHMGEFILGGQGADTFLQGLLTNDVLAAVPGQVIYSPMCRPDGGVVDDLLAYRKQDGTWLLVVNAGNIEKDFAWISSLLTEGLYLRDVSDDVAQIAIQGPESEKILQKLTQFSLTQLKFYRFEDGVSVGGIRCLVSRTGYTGEDGFELYLQADRAGKLWALLMEAGSPHGLIPAGLGARDTLRFESALPLYGHEMDDTISPLEAGLGKFVKLTKAEFTGKEALEAQKNAGVSRMLSGLEMTGRGIPRSGYPVMSGDRVIGHVTSGSPAPSLKKHVAMALLEPGFTEPGTEVTVIIREKPVEAVIVPLPFYQKRYRK